MESLREELKRKNDEVTLVSNNLKKELPEELTNLKTNFNEWKSQETEKLEQERSEFEDQKTKLITSAEEKVTKLERLYEEKLKLAAPAAYWKEKAKAFNTSGRSWGASLILCTLASCGVFIWLFSKWLTTGEMVEAFSTKHWQGIILLLTILSLVAFLLRTFGRLTFSAFHLQRDAEEREQLAYVYLALSTETTMNDETRKVIMQALFSRSDSGLLPGDHGPTMPNAAEIVSSVKK